MRIIIVVLIVIIIALIITLHSKSSKKDEWLNEFDVQLLGFLKSLLTYGSKDSPLFLKENYNGLEDWINIIKKASWYPNDPSLATSTKKLLKYFDKYMPYLKDLSDLGSETILLHDHVLDALKVFNDKDLDWSIKNAKPLWEQLCNDFKNQAEVKTNLQDLVHNTIDMLKQEGDEYWLIHVFKEQSIWLAKIHDTLEKWFSKITGLFVYEMCSRYDYKEWSKKIKWYESDSIREYAESLQKDWSNNKAQSAHKKNEKKI